MRFLFGLADRISVIHWGQVIARGTPGGAARESVGPAVEPGGAGVSAILAPRTEPMLSVERITTFYGETQALFGVSLAVGAGEVVALLGPNGAGKTTTLRSILGLTPPRAGRDPLRRTRRHPPGRRTRSRAPGVGWVPDDRRIFPTLTVARNLAIARKRTRFRAWTRRNASRSSARSST